MTAKEFLQRFNVLQRIADSRLDQITKLQSTAKRTTSVMRDTPIGKAADVSCVENSVATIHDLTAQFADDLARAMTARTEIADAISNVKNDDERYLLELRYVCRDSWERIAKRMNFSLDHVFTLHRRALKKFVFPTNLTVNNS